MGTSDIGPQSRLPRLPANHGESLRLGNGDIGVAVYAVPECVVLFIGKNDLLDCRTKPLAHSPEATNISNAETPMPTTRPAGWIRFRNATARNPDAKALLDIWNAEVREEAELLLKEWSTPRGGFILIDYGDGAAIGVSKDRKQVMLEAFQNADPWK